MSQHELKLRSEFFKQIDAGTKTFELRKDDRNPAFAKGDLLHLNEINAIGEYSGRTIEVLVLGVLRDYPGIALGYCILSIQKRRVNF